MEDACFYVVLRRNGSMNYAAPNLATMLAGGRLGAVEENHRALKSLIRDEGRVVGTVARGDVEGDVFPVYAKVVVNATGPSRNGTQPMFEPTGCGFPVLHSAGACLTPKYITHTFGFTRLNQNPGW